MCVRIQHTTRYTYEAPAGLGPHTLRLCPAPHLASRVLTYNLYRRYVDDSTCERSFQMYGQGCYAPAIFCADGNRAVLQTDIMNECTYDLFDGFLYNALLVEGDVPPVTQWSVVDDGTRRDWNGELWHLDDGDPDMTWVCDPEHQGFDTGPWDSGGDTAAVDTDVVDTDPPDTDLVP